MANGIKIGNSNLTLKVGSTEVTAAYLGSTLVYSGGTPTFNGKWLATYSGGSTSSAECDSSSAITGGEITIENLVSVQIGDCVTNIDYNAFAGCSGLTSIDIPDSVRYIGAYAFESCTSLTSCTIGSGITFFEMYPISNCPNLTSITIKATTPPEVEGNSFDDTNDCPIYVPSASVSAYKTATNWSNYASRIQAIP